MATGGGSPRGDDDNYEADEDNDIYSGFSGEEDAVRDQFLADSSVLAAMERNNSGLPPTTSLNLGRGADYLASPGQQQQLQRRRHYGQGRLGSAATGNTNLNAASNNNANAEQAEPARSTVSRMSTTRGAGFRPGTGGVRVTLSRGATGFSSTRPGTARPGDSADTPANERPMTAVTGAGFRSRLAPMEEDPSSGGQKNDVIDFEPKLTEEERTQLQMEKSIRKLCQKCAFLSSDGEHAAALSKAKEAGKMERDLKKRFPSDPDCNTWLVLNNLSSMYACCGATTEAINANRVIVKRKEFDDLWRFKTKLNTGVLYYRQGKFDRAVKLFRMALDGIVDDEDYVMRDLKRKTRRNIAICFIKMRKYREAIRDLEVNMREVPDFENGYNLIICHSVVGNFKDAMLTFTRMLQTPLGIDLKDDKYQERPNDKAWNKLLEVIRNDTLRDFEKEKVANAQRLICLATKIIARDIKRSHAEGFDWCIDQVKNSPYEAVAADIEIGKAIHFLKEKDTESAIKTLKSFERQGHNLNCSAAINLSFLYFHERDYLQAARYVDIAINADRYNPAALVNKGVIYFREGKYEKSREFFREAIGTESTSVEALFNLGLANKVLASTTKDSKYYEDALECFQKLQNIVGGYPPVIYQIADLYEKLHKYDLCAEWFLLLQGLLPTDPGCLRRIGEIYDHDFKDKNQAFQYHMDSYRYFPSEVETIEWLGAYYIESSYWEKAIEYFERAAVIQPGNSRWIMVIASCYRRAGNYNKALDTYKICHKKFPDNEECLKFIVKLGHDLRLPGVETYQTKLKDLQQQHANKNKNRKSSIDGGNGNSAIFPPRVSRGTSDAINAFHRRKEIEQELDRMRREREEVGGGSGGLREEGRVRDDGEGGGGFKPSDTIETLLNPELIFTESDEDSSSLASDAIEPWNLSGGNVPATSWSSQHAGGQVMKMVEFFGDEEDDLPDSLLPL